MLSAILVNFVSFIHLSLVSTYTVQCNTVHCRVGYNEFYCFWKIKITEFKSMAHNTFFDFWRRFLRVWLQSLKKVLIWPTFFCLIIKGIKKRRISCWFQIRRKSFKNAPEQVMSKTSLTNMSKSGKSAYFRHVFAMLSLLCNIMFITLIRKLYLLI